jgi:hypothetical protein
MALTTKLQEALDLIQRAQGIVQAHLMAPVCVKDPQEYRKEVLRRLQAADQVAEAEMWVRRLDSDRPRRIVAELADGSDIVTPPLVPTL